MNGPVRAHVSTTSSVRRLSGAVADVLSGASGIAGVRGVVTGRAAKTALHAALENLTDGAVHLGAARVRRAKFKPGRRLDAYYDVRVDDHAGARSRAVMVRWTPAADGHEGAASAPTSRPDGAEVSGPPFRHLVATEPVLGMRVNVSPFDPAFPQLPYVCDPRHVHDALREIVDQRSARRGAATLPSVTTVRYRPGERHVLRYDVPHAGGRPTAAPWTLFAKLYRAGDAERAWRVATTVSEWLEDGSPGFAAARPLAVLPDDDLLVYERCPGRPLTHWLRRAPSRVDEHLRTVGAGLRRLQRPPGPLAADLRVHTFDGEIRAIASTSEHLQVLIPRVGATVRDILDRCGLVHERVPAEPSCFAHGDFKLDHVWLASGEITLIDHDSCTVADPALDVGKFLADLDWWTTRADRWHDVGKAREAFLVGYGADAPEERLVRARMYEVLILTKIAARRVMLWDPEWVERTRLLIDRAAELLDELESDGSPTTSPSR